MVKKKPNAKPNFVEDGIGDKADHPTRKRGRPRKIIAEEEDTDLFEEADVGEDEEEEELEEEDDTVKKNKGRTAIAAEQQKKQHMDKELQLPPSLSSDHTVAINIVAAKPKSRGRRKGQPRKSF